MNILKDQQVLRTIYFDRHGVEIFFFFSKYFAGTGEENERKRRNREEM
jgi:hypothetical protein